jgi:putative endonuclease
LEAGLLEEGEDRTSVLERDKQIKSWPRSRKVALIEGKNPTWRDLFFEIQA